MSTATTIKPRKVTNFECVQDCPLPRGSIAAQVRAIESYYRKISSSDLCAFDRLATVKLLDQILEDRADQADPSMPSPLPPEYGVVKRYLEQQGYPKEWVRVCIRQIARHKTAMGLESIEEEDQAECQKILDWPNGDPLPWSSGEAD